MKPKNNQNYQFVFPSNGMPKELDYSLDIQMEISEFMKLLTNLNERIVNEINLFIKKNLSYYFSEFYLFDLTEKTWRD